MKKVVCATFWVGKFPIIELFAQGFGFDSGSYVYEISSMIKALPPF